jgi:nicotinamide-nucleotide amidase
MGRDRSAEIICVGTELLLGEILNSNAQFLATELAQLGIPHYYQTVVGDNVQRLQQVVSIAAERSSLLIFTGGLGPTPDDLTTEALADLFNTPLVERPEIVADLTAYYAQRDRPMPPSNLKQALLPQGADILTNRMGTAPGIIWQPTPALTILTFPGVPREMKTMWQEVAVPYLRRQGWGTTPIHSRILRFWGISESGLAEQVSHLLTLPNPTVAPYASQGEIRLRLSTQADSAAAAQACIAPIEQQIRQITGIDCFGADDDTLAAVVGHLLQSAQQTLSVAESCTGGGLGHLLTSVAGSSAYFRGGIISYDNAVKIDLLGVSADDLDTQGAVSDAVAQQMAAGVRSRLQTDWGLGITGIAGPDGGTAEKPVGLVYIGLAAPDGRILSRRFQFSDRQGRDWVRWLSSCTALDWLRRDLLSTSFPKSLA